LATITVRREYSLNSFALRNAEGFNAQDRWVASIEIQTTNDRQIAAFAIDVQVLDLVQSERRFFNNGSKSRCDS